MSRRFICHCCQNAKNLCLCSLLKPIQTKTCWNIIVHPRESRRKTRTGIWAHRFLKNSQYQLAESKSSLINSEKQPYLLFPSDKSISTLDLISGPASIDNIEIVVLEGTWSQAKKMLLENSELQALPKLTLSQTYQSGFKIRQQPKSGCLSTLEAIAIGLLEMKDINRSDYEAMLSLFNTMVERQIESQNRWNPFHFQKWNPDQSTVLI